MVLSGKSVFFFFTFCYPFFIVLIHCPTPSVTIFFSQRPITWKKLHIGHTFLINFFFFKVLFLFWRKGNLDCNLSKSSVKKEIPIWKISLLKNSYRLKKLILENKTPFLYQQNRYWLKNIAFHITPSEK